MWTTDRRSFLTHLSRGVLAAGLGTSAAARAAWAMSLGDDPAGALDLGEFEELAALMQETPPFELQALLIERLRAGATLHQLVAAGSLANARTFGGQDYTGYHCMMAMVPALSMSRLLPEREAPVPVLKVLHRSAARIQEHGGREEEALHALPEAGARDRGAARKALREAMFTHDMDRAEQAFADLATGSPADTLDDVQSILHENLDVHRIVLAWRAWETLEITGKEHSQTLLRQAVRFCVDAEQKRVDRGRPEPELRTLLPELLESAELESGAHGTRRLSDEELGELCDVIFSSPKADAAHAVARCLGGGTAPEDVGEAMSLAANRLLLQDPGRTRGTTFDKPKGSVHGASTGVHASDAARAWRNLGRVSNPRNAAACLIAGAYHTAGQSGYVGDAAFPYRERLADVKGSDGPELLAELREALEAGDQAFSCAATERYCELGRPERPLFDLLLEFAVSEDGALHAEKYYQTACEEFRESRPAFRKAHLLALARVTASESGWPAPGVAEAREQLGV